MIKRMISLFASLLFTMTIVTFSYGEALSPQLCKDKAKAAAALLKAQGDAALPLIKDPNGEFMFADGKGYIWVHNLDGIMVMHPIKPSLDGKGLNEMRDVNGVYLFVSMNDLVEEKGEGWVPYSWPKPGEKNSSPKVSYVVLVQHGDKDYVAGSGMYDVTAADIKKMFPNDAIYEDE